MNHNNKTNIFQDSFDENPTPNQSILATSESIHQKSLAHGTTMNGTTPLANHENIDISRLSAANFSLFSPSTANMSLATLPKLDDDHGSNLPCSVQKENVTQQNELSSENQVKSSKSFLPNPIQRKCEIIFDSHLPPCSNF